VSQFSNHHWQLFLRYLTGTAVLAVICFCVPHQQVHDFGSFFRVLFTESFGVFAEWPAAWASLVVILLAGCVFCLVRALDELLPLFNRECFSAGIFYGLMLLPVLLFSIGTFLLARALF
jgi:hypothetical protein